MKFLYKFLVEFLESVGRITKDIHGKLFEAILRGVFGGISPRFLGWFSEAIAWRMSEEIHGCFFKWIIREISEGIFQKLSCGISFEEIRGRVSEADWIDLIF